MRYRCYLPCGSCLWPGAAPSRVRGDASTPGAGACSELRPDSLESVLLSSVQGSGVTCCASDGPQVGVLGSPSHLASRTGAPFFPGASVRGQEVWGAETRQPGALSQRLSSPSLGLWEETQRERNLLFTGEAARISPGAWCGPFPGGRRALPAEWTRGLTCPDPLPASGPPRCSPARLQTPSSHWGRRAAGGLLPGLTPLAAVSSWGMTVPHLSLRLPLRVGNTSETKHTPVHVLMHRREVRIQVPRPWWEGLLLTWDVGKVLSGCPHPYLPLEPKESAG